MWMKIQRVKTVIYSAALLAAASSLMSVANAAEELQTTLRVAAHLRAGHVPEGMQLAQGWVTYHGSHSGFRVWNDEQKAGNTPSVLLLNGQQDPRHHIRVRLEGEGWQPDTASGSGAILRTAADNASFSVVVDGDQEVPADTWTLDFKTGALSPEEG
ncbi:AfaD family invasin [Yersinia enterocolitica]|uniref:AfaD family invasin n=2 Tax=Yersinia kristensenii TaxID=28152 RepID=UPI001C6093AC|nr:AfaD family invasin [Yersinia kristensenii]EKN4774150.1 pilin structural protein SafD [Yersinia enterocolitica]MBW5818932.1 pilin structural protein SafD [Yersinia kristensenii]MBW5844545.1 pilin structural protein SafD [Yersinia kristensenii]